MEVAGITDMAFLLSAFPALKAGARTLESSSSILGGKVGDRRRGRRSFSVAFSFCGNAELRVDGGGVVRDFFVG